MTEISEHSPFDHEMEAGFLEFLFKAEELFKQAGPFRVGLFKSGAPLFHREP